MATTAPKSSQSIIARRNEVAAKLARGEYSGPQEEQAVAFVQRVDKAASSAKVKTANRMIMRGAILLCVGLAITIGSFALASGGGFFVVMFGPVIFGAIYLARGLMLRMNVG